MQHLNSDLNYNLATLDQQSDNNTMIDLERFVFMLFYDRNGENKPKLFKKLYAYPEADLCLFKDFPHRRLVAPLVLAPMITYSCMLVWLLWYSTLY